MPVPKSDPQSVERRSLRQIAIEKIKAAILDHTLQPGEDLKDEELMGWLGMSRTPIREALIELTRIGLVETEAQRFTRVANPDPTTAFFDLQTVGALLGGVTRVTVATLTETATKEILVALDDIADALEAGDTVEFLSRSNRLSHILLGQCPNPVLTAATEDHIDAKLFRLSLSRVKADRDWGELKGINRELYAAIKSHDAIAAELAIERVFQLDLPFPPTGTNEHTSN